MIAKERKQSLRYGGRSVFNDFRSFLEPDAKFGGLTAFSQSPAEGLWTKDDQRTKRDEIIMLEVMVGDLDRAWWAGYRKQLQIRLKQDSIMIRALPIEQL